MCFFRSGLATTMQGIRSVFKALDDKHKIIVCGADEHIRIRTQSESLAECLIRMADVLEGIEKSMAF